MQKKYKQRGCLMNEKEIAWKINDKIMKITQSLIDKETLTLKKVEELNTTVIQEVNKYPKNQRDNILLHLWELSRIP